MSFREIAGFVTKFEAVINEIFASKMVSYNPSVDLQNERKTLTSILLIQLQLTFKVTSV